MSNQDSGIRRSQPKKAQTKDVSIFDLVRGSRLEMVIKESGRIRVRVAPFLVHCEGPGTLSVAVELNGDAFQRQHTALPASSDR